MKKVKFIYNPYSGENLIVDKIDKVIKIHQEAGYTIIPFRIDEGFSVFDAFLDINEGYSYILIAGGDGTVDSVVNVMKQKDISIPIGIIPVGTANDFAKVIGMPQEVEEACAKIIKSKPVAVDIGSINNKYFINVASTGLFTDVSQKTDDNLKNTIGKLAYYLKGIEQLPNFRKLKVTIKSEEVVFDDYMYLLLVFNGASAGNLRLAPEAHITDGLLDVVIFRAVAIKDLLPLVIRVFRGEHLDDPGVLHFKTKELTINSLEDIVTDIDGERGPDFPLSIKCVHEGIRVLGIKEKP